MSLQPSELSFTVTMLSDWHSGTGTTGPDGIDRDTLVDERGLPRVSRKHFIGVLRDQAERIAFGLDNAQHDGAWQQLVVWLFGTQPGLGGSPAPGLEPRKFSLAGLHQHPGVAGSLSPAQAAATSRIVRPGVKINAETGLAADNHLRMVAFARKGAVLRGLISTTGLSEAAWSLLVVALAGVERVGGKRRRGGGRCRVEVDQALVREAIEWLEDNETPDKLPEPTTADHRVEATVATPDWVSFRLHIDLLAPLVAPSSRLGNIVSSFDFIPGATLLAALQQQFGWPVSAAVQAAELVVSDGRPFAGAVCIPVPRCFAHPKNNSPREPGEIVDLSSSDGSRDDGVRLTQFKGAWCTVESAGSKVVHVRKGLATHNVISDEEQRPTSEVGGLFSYEFIGQGQRFAADVVARGVVAERLKDAISVGFAARLGTSRNDEYGHASITVEASPRHAPALGVGSEYRVVAVGDLVLTDDTDMPVCSAAAFFQAVSSLLPDAKLSLLEDKSFVSVGRRESWHGRWGMPRPTLLVIERGSVVHVQVGAEVSAEDVARALQAGVGQRRAEGFGQLALMPRQDIDSVTATEPDAVPAQSTCQLSDPEKAFATVLWQAHQREEILRRAADIAASKENPLAKVGRPQRGSLRAQLARIETDEDLRELQGWLEHIKATPNRSRLWGKPLNRLIRLADANDASLQELYWPADGSDGLDLGELRTFALTSLLTACAQASRGGDPSGSADQ